MKNFMFMLLGMLLTGFVACQTPAPCPVCPVCKLCEDCGPKAEALAKAEIEISQLKQELLDLQNSKLPSLDTLKNSKKKK